MYIPIFSKSIVDFVEKDVLIIGKVIDISEDRKMSRIKVLDYYGYLDIRFFENIDIKIFDTVMVLGKVKLYDNYHYIYGRYIVKLLEREEIFWRMRFLKKIKRKVKKKQVKDINMEDKKDKNFDEIEDKDIRLRKEILEYIKENDKGDGVSLKDIYNFFEEPEEKIENIIKDLLSSGEIYESSLEKYKLI
ncbi:hypothetical protein MJ1_0021 [Nanobdella aerobiophila]|uniref:Replication protein A C-terminal domain-containing protein n=1 Tax=Nanobdella aerobiophila TaxID=2586965 RepID=A0A915SS73_9ARCH|nr:hypothetical protein [Nanobdella aerobiophila]BBL45201.1 hypothetical protein MJ1_0021 [Nanobdella aerobiophila]